MADYSKVFTGRGLRMVDDPRHNWRHGQTIIIIADSSSSVRGQFMSEKRLMEYLISQYPHQGLADADLNQYCVIQFSNSAYMVCHPTNDASEAVAAIHRMPYRAGTSNIYAALKLALKVINRVHRGRYQVWLITDGACAGLEPTSCVSGLKGKGAVITVIGVGCTHQHRLHDIASPNRVFLPHDFDAAIEMVRSGTTHIDEINFRVTLMKESNRLTDAVPFKLSIQNDSCSIIEASSKVKIAAKSRFWQPTKISLGKNIPVAGTHVFEFELMCRPSIKSLGFAKAFKRLEERVAISLVTGDNTRADPRACELRFCLPLDMFAQDLYDLKPVIPQGPRCYIPPVDTFNLCLLGRPGTGKSSFIATLDGSLSPHPAPDILNANRGARSTEHFVQLSKVYQLEALSKIAAEFFDTPGYEGSSDVDAAEYRGIDLGLLVAGYLPENIKLVRDSLCGRVFGSADIPKEQRLSVEEAWPRAIHCGILFIHASSVGTDLEYEAKIASEWTRVHDRVLIVVISQIDRVTSAERRLLGKRVSSVTSVDEDFIFLMKNYCSLSKSKLQKNFWIDKMALQILHAALTGAQTFLERWHSTIDKIVMNGTQELHHLVLLSSPHSGPHTPEGHDTCQVKPRSIHSDAVMLKTIRKLVKSTIPEESRLSKEERDRLEELLVDYPNSEEAKHWIQAFSLLYSTNGTAADSVEEEALVSIGRSLRRHLDNKPLVLPATPTNDVTTVADNV
ncbi:hypothetical protein SeLEV6574_g07958 [Synchytrium endobioticum]|uniref:VWFA domain-containing protein n=1 Tax=Synchytrium endobioticum TaxID=286115 RepID=A0A507CD28_9FUNG|nr:hypothetical protein SeLEV6574_g07958 [Synchytrium endobioticum]